MRSFKVWYRIGHWVSSVRIGLPDLGEITEEHLHKVAKSTLSKRFSKEQLCELEFMKIEEL